MTSRRNFLKGALLGGAAAAAVSTVSEPACARGNNPQPKNAVGLLYDAALCVGCKACVAACKEANNLPAEFTTPDQLWDTPVPSPISSSCMALGRWSSWITLSSVRRMARSMTFSSSRTLPGQR